MNGLKHFKIYALAALSAAVLDYFWTRFPARILYQPFFDAITVRSYAIVSAVFLYAAYTAALYVFALRPALIKKSSSTSLFNGAFTALAAGIIFHVAALIAGLSYPPYIAGIDIVWRILEGAMAATIAYHIEISGE